MHIKPKEIKAYPFYLRWFFKSQEKKLGQVLLPGLFWGRIPFLQVLFLFFWGHLDRKSSPLESGLRALVQVRVAQLNWCSFCIDINSLNLLNRTNSTQKADLLDEWETNEIFNAKERVTMRYVGLMTNKEVKIPKEVMDELKSHFTDDQIVELTALIAFQNMSAKFNAALDIPSQGLCKMPVKGIKGEQP